MGDYAVVSGVEGAVKLEESTWEKCDTAPVLSLRDMAMQHSTSTFR